MHPVTTQTTQPRTYEVRTFGCQMNVHDSERISGLLESAGYTAAGDQEPDLIVFNTCAVRENADKRLYGTCLLYTSPSPRDATLSRMPSSA